MTPKNKPTDNILFELGFTTFDGNKKVYNLYEGNTLMILYTDLFQKENFDEIRLVKKDNPSAQNVIVQWSKMVVLNFILIKM